MVETLYSRSTHPSDNNSMKAIHIGAAIRRFAQKRGIGWQWWRRYTRMYKWYFGCSAQIASDRAHSRARARARPYIKGWTNKCEEFRSKRRRTLISFHMASARLKRSTHNNHIVFFSGFSHAVSGDGGGATMELYVIVNHSKNFASLRGILFMH